MAVSDKVKIIPSPYIEEYGIVLAKMKVLQDISCNELEELEGYIKSTLLRNVELMNGAPDYDYDLYLATIKMQVDEDKYYYFDLLIADGNRICDEEPYFRKGEKLEIYLSPAPWQEE